MSKTEIDSDYDDEDVKEYSEAILGMTEAEAASCAANNLGKKAVNYRIEKSDGCPEGSSNSNGTMEEAEVTFKKLMKVLKGAEREMTNLHTGWPRISPPPLEKTLQTKNHTALWRVFSTHTCITSHLN